MHLLTHTRRFACIFAATLMLWGCGHRGKPLKIATGKPGTVYHQVGGGITNLLASELGMRAQVDTTGVDGNITSCRKLLSGEVDFALIQDDTPIDSCLSPGSARQDSDLRTILPIFPELLFIFHQEGIQAGTLKQLITGRRVGLDEETSSDARFALRMFQEFGISRDDFTPVFLPHSQLRVSDSLPVVVMLTAYTDPKVQEQFMQHEAQLFSLDDPVLKDRGSAADGFCLKYIHAHTFILPRHTFGRHPAKPVLTVAVDAVLTTRRDVDEDLVYKIAQLLIEEEARLANKNPLFRFLTEDFDRQSLDFPLHEGSIRFLERDEPGFIERFAEVIAMSISAVILFWGAATAFFRWMEVRKKNRIDVYYNAVLQLERDSLQYADPAQIRDALEELHRLREEAFVKLVDEKLMANESFLIFTQLLANVQSHLKDRLERMG